MANIHFKCHKVYSIFKARKKLSDTLNNHKIKKYRTKTIKNFALSNLWLKQLQYKHSILKMLKYFSWLYTAKQPANLSRHAVWCKHEQWKSSKT